ESLVEDWDQLSGAEQELVRAHLDVAYQAELAWVSDAIDNLISDADAAGQLDNTLVVFWSDHGEELTEHGDIGHHVNLYDETNRAFAAFWAKGLAAEQYDGRTVHGNVWPTVLEVLPHAFANELPGPALGDEDNALRFGQKVIGDSSSAFVEDGDHKLLVWSTGDAELYDLAVDADEQDNLVTSDPATAASLWAELDPYIGEVEGLEVRCLHLEGCQNVLRVLEALSVCDWFHEVERLVVSRGFMSEDGQLNLGRRPNTTLRTLKLDLCGG
ncbi:MAG: sulfatase-like hydrolase/transferase, partial [Proteobacteria bacterium]|nr:sulfatase-like hydrolase/transferase [Pseudomonadota bacterium]